MEYNKISYNNLRHTFSSSLRLRLFLYNLFKNPIQLKEIVKFL